MVDFGEVDVIAGAPPKTQMVTISNPGTDSFDLTALERMLRAWMVDEAER